MNNIREICSFGFAYSCVISFSLFGPLLGIVAGAESFLYILLALGAFVLSYLNPFFQYFTKKRIFGMHIVISISFLLTYSLKTFQELILFLFAFEIATLSRGFTLHVFSKIKERESEAVMAASFMIAFSTLYIINVLEPLLSKGNALLLVVFLSTIAVVFYQLAMDEAIVGKKYEAKFQYKEFLPLGSLYLVYIGGGISYAGIYPYLEKFYYIDRYYNVLPLIFFLPAAGYIGKRYGNLINLFIGTLFLSVSFTCFMLPLTDVSYCFVQTFLQIGWAFTNVYGFSYSWRLAVKKENPYLFGYGIISILLGVTSGSAVANMIVISGLSKVFFGPFTFIPLVVSLIFHFFHSDFTWEKEGSGTHEISTVYRGKSLDLLSFCELAILTELTEREKEVLFYYYNSDTAVKIAETLHLSPNTIRTHIKNAYSKLGISKRDQLRDLIDGSCI